MVSKTPSMPSTKPIPIARVFECLALVTSVFTLNFDWFIAMFASVVIGQDKFNNLLFILRYSIENCSVQLFQLLISLFN